MRVLLTVLGLLSLVVVASAAIWWMFIASFGDRQIQDFVARSEKDGATITIASQERSGFPLAVNWQLRGIKIAYPSPEGGLTGEVPDLVVTADVWRPQHLTYSARQPQKWQWQPTSVDGMREYSIQSVDGVLMPQETQPGWLLTAELADAQWRVNGAGATDGSAESLSAKVLLPLDQQTADYTLRVRRMNLGKPQVFGQFVENAFAAGDIAPLPKSLTPAGLILWQQEGGGLIIRRSEIAFGALQAMASGELQLDPAMRPAGKFKLQVINPQSILAIASREGWVKPDQIAYAQMGVGLFSRQNAQGETELNTDLSMREGGLWVGPVRLLNLKPVLQIK